MVDGWVTNHSKLTSEIACRFNEEVCTIIRFNSKRDWASVILFGQPLATRPCTTWLRSPSVLGDAEECHNRHDGTKCSCHIDIFRGKTSSETLVWIGVTGLWHDQHKYPFLARNKGCGCVEQNTQMMQLRSALAVSYDNFSKIQTRAFRR